MFQPLYLKVAMFPQYTILLFDCSDFLINRNVKKFLQQLYIAKCLETGPQQKKLLHNEKKKLNYIPIKLRNIFCEETLHAARLWFILTIGEGYMAVLYCKEIPESEITYFSH